MDYNDGMDKEGNAQRMLMLQIIVLDLVVNVSDTADVPMYQYKYCSR